MSLKGRDPAETVLFSSREIASGIEKLAKTLANAPLRPDIVVPVLAGAFIFAADLMRALAAEGLDLETDFVWLRSYGRFERAGDVMVLKGPTASVRGKTVLLVDGVLESGATLARAKELLDEEGAAAIVSVVAVVKPYAAPLFHADYALFRGPEAFLYGYGMDAKGFGRGLPDIRVRSAETA